ncbi:MAG: cupin domain-containing protein [bacterium]
MNVVEWQGRVSFSDDKMQKVPLFDSERMFCDVYCFRPGQEQRAHRHDASDKVYVVLQGSGTFRVGAEERVLRAGQAVMAPAGEEHGARNSSDDELVVLVIMAPKP